jgi:hypothetical protein
VSSLDGEPGTRAYVALRETGALSHTLDGVAFHDFVLLQAVKGDI